ncbi:hypothetical protein SAMD00019534_105410 [Acytostelium subglobosum LB1]|uniref:hypothetical protein n=1 Tax=Acytostelium subglobosum LB1 TaxID=1410327 RepID=UPI000644A6E2|nr:hypothetical protein SAMD00019534_105410 [Acytostelium subglobosum LB1]GAM27366.1 hypothetical protein SAMD00019534_105410 [Acytostelium subglobosum LB1]|eukprot:XP_012749833.1 hypothetical protein SAMD00019534_105410 [Acytostelium subglobosum LB1]
MLILIKSPTITFSLDVQPTDDVQVLYNKVAERTEYKIFQFDLLYAGEKIEIGNPVSGTGIKKETTVHMLVIKELKFVVLYKNMEHPVSVPNNDGLTIATLMAQIKNMLTTSIPELATHDIVLKKAGSPTALVKHSSLHTTLANMEVLEMELTERPKVETYNAPAAADEQFDQDALLSSFVESSISSDVEIVFCFDTTGSMSSIIQNVRSQVEKTVSRLMKDIPNIRIGIMGLGDYCDASKVLTTLDLSQNLDELVQFIKNVPGTGGGDAPEAYEWALKKAKELTWSTHTSKAFVMIGDANPHEPSHTNLSINWLEECDELFDMGVKIYGVKALGNSPFYEEIAKRTGGVCINFKNFSFITEMFLAICYREASKEKFKKFESELATQTQNGDMSSIMADLNKENFEVVVADSKTETPAATETTTTTSTTTTASPDTAPTGDITSLAPKKDVVVKVRGKPTAMRSNEGWFNHDRDHATKPTYYFQVDLGYFTTQSDGAGTYVSKDVVPASYTHTDGTVSRSMMDTLFIGSYFGGARPKTKKNMVVSIVGDTMIGKSTFVEAINNGSMGKVKLQEQTTPYNAVSLSNIAAYGVCFDVTNMNSLSRVQSYVNRIKSIDPKAKIFIVALKTDLADPSAFPEVPPAVTECYNVHHFSRIASKEEMKSLIYGIKSEVMRTASCSIM